MAAWHVFSYIGLSFAVVYRVPQIVKIYRKRSAADISAYSYITHNGAYVSFILYLWGTGKYRDEWVLGSYYMLGFLQNALIYAMKRHYDRVGRVEPIQKPSIECASGGT